jgi:hypothetical protein
MRKLFKQKFPYEIEIKDKYIKEYISSFFARANAINNTISELSEIKQLLEKNAWIAIRDLFPETKGKHLNFDNGKKCITILGENSNWERTEKFLSATEK